MAAVAVEALYRKFETAVEQKSGVSKLQLLYDEITQEELTRQQRKEQKKLKRRKKKERQAVESKCKVCFYFKALAVELLHYVNFVKVDCKVCFVFDT